jgi:hypothetical protein
MDSGYRPFTGPCEHSNEPSGSIRSWQFDYLGNYEQGDKNNSIFAKKLKTEMVQLFTMHI